MTIAEMKEQKRNLGYTNQKIAELSGVPLGTVQKVFAGSTKAPRLDTLLALEKVLRERQPQSNSWARPVSKTPPGLLREETSAYAADPHQGHYTIEDVYALPEDRRVELIDGVIYDMSSPSRVHQSILGQLYLQLAPCVEKHPGCELFFAPADVRLDNDEYTLVQPDLYINCSKEETDKRRFNGAPDFIIEILSPSNKGHDLFLKQHKYQHAGVREYWVIDPQKLRILVYDFEHEAFPEIYTFKDTVPVQISDGRCSVDFAVIYEKSRKYM